MKKLFTAHFLLNNKLGFQLCNNPHFQLYNHSRFQFSSNTPKTQFSTATKSDQPKEENDIQQQILKVLIRIEESQTQAGESQAKMITKMIESLVQGQEKLISNTNTIIRFTNPLSQLGLGLGISLVFVGGMYQLFFIKIIEQLHDSNNFMAYQISEQNSRVSKMQGSLETLAYKNNNFKIAYTPEKTSTKQ